MTTESHLPAPDTAPYASPAVLGLSLQLLRAWEAQAGQLAQLCPKTEAELWADTELDPRRTVL